MGRKGYGKFGSNPANYRSYGIVPLDSVTQAEADPTLELGRNHGPWMWAGCLGAHGLMVGQDPVTGEPNPVESKYFNVATAASITGFVRAFLLRHIDRVVANPKGKVLYCDTDSIVYQMPGGVETHPFALSKKLGDWGYEGKFQSGAIAGKKLYAFRMDSDEYKKACEDALKKGDKKKPKEWKTATKGVKLDAEAIVRVAEGEEITWESAAPLFSVHAKMKKRGEVIQPKWMHRKVRMT